MYSDPPVISLERVVFSLEGKIILNEIDLHIFNKEIFVLIGESGCGKSTLLKLCVGLFKPDQGIVRVNGLDMNNISNPELQKMRLKIGFIFQKGALISNMRIKDNISLPLRYHTKLKEEAIQAIVREKLSLVKMEKYENFFPAELSEGLKKRASLARALVMNPSLIFYDEPISGIDLKHAQLVVELIKELNQRFGVTSVVVTHDIHQIKTISNRSAIIEQGKITLIETSEETKKNIYSFF